MKKFFILLTVLLAIVFAVATDVDARRHYDDYEDDYCWECGGSGNCPKCDGRGYINGYDYDKRESIEEPCEECDGSGKCSRCGGSGWD